MGARAWARTFAARPRHARGLERVDLTIADRVEKELDRAREAIAALDADVAERALARAETLLREHPELPQAAWLRAEVHRSWAARWTRVEPRDDQRAQARGRKPTRSTADAPPASARSRSRRDRAPRRRSRVAGAPRRASSSRGSTARSSTGTHAADGDTTYALDVAAQPSTSSS